MKRKDIIMIEMSSTEARQNFGAFLDRGSREIVIIKRQNREVGAFVPMKELEKLRRLQIAELTKAASDLSAEGQSNGLTEAILNDILSEVNPS